MLSRKILKGYLIVLIGFSGVNVLANSSSVNEVAESDEINYIMENISLENWAADAYDIITFQRMKADNMLREALREHKEAKEKLDEAKKERERVEKYDYGCNCYK